MRRLPTAKCRRTSGRRWLRAARQRPPVQAPQLQPAPEGLPEHPADVPRRLLHALHAARQRRGRELGPLRDAARLALQVRRQPAQHVRLQPTYERLFEPFEISPGVVLPPGEYRFTRFRSNLLSTATKRAACRRASTSYTAATGRARLSRRLPASPTSCRRGLTLTVTANQTFARLPEGRSSPASSPPTRTTPSPTLSLSNLVQYDNRSATWLASRLRWTLQPGNDLFVAFNQGWIQEKARVSAVSCRGHQDFGQDSILGALLMPAAATWIDRQHALAAVTIRWQASTADAPRHRVRLRADPTARGSASSRSPSPARSH